MLDQQKLYRWLRRTISQGTYAAYAKAYRAVYPEAGGMEVAEYLYYCYQAEVAARQRLDEIFGRQES